MDPEIFKWREAIDRTDSHASLLVETTNNLRLAREKEKPKELVYLLTGVMKRNHLGIDEEQYHNMTTEGVSKIYINDFLQEVNLCLRYLYETHNEEMSSQEKLNFFLKIEKSLGHSALALSGGGALAMYHFGVVLTLIKNNLFPSVVSGASGGSIVAGMLAIKTSEELLEQVIVDGVSTDFTKDGEQKRRNIVWFPSLLRQTINFIKTVSNNRFQLSHPINFIIQNFQKGYLLDHKDFQTCCEFYYSNVTFAEGFELTGRHVSITVSGAQLGSFSTQQRLVLNHITTPFVTISSAVAASCALPGVQKPNPLLAKKSNGEIVPFLLDGVAWIDGSIHADVPYVYLVIPFYPHTLSLCFSLLLSTTTR